jgi:hypothetical protein
VGSKGVAVTGFSSRDEEKRSVEHSDWPDGAKKVEEWRKWKIDEDGARYTRERIAHLNEDVKCFAANSRK